MIEPETMKIIAVLLLVVSLIIAELSVRHIDDPPKLIKSKRHCLRGKIWNEKMSEHLRIRGSSRMNSDTTIDALEENKAKGMCYLVAYKSDEAGCVALKTESGKVLAALVSYLNLRFSEKGIDILIVSDPVIYGEYKPYRFVESEKEFIIKVFEM